MSLYEVLKGRAKKSPNLVGVSFYGKRYSFLRLLRLVDRASLGLKRLGVKKGDVVTLCMLNTPSALVAFYALNKLGAIVNLVHPKIVPVQLQASIKKTGSCMLIVFDIYFKVHEGAKFDCKVLVSRSGYFMGLMAKTFFGIKAGRCVFDDEVFERLVEDKAADGLGLEAAEFGKNEPAVYLPSGGTTGTPKIIIHSNEAFVALCAHAQYFLSEPLANYGAMYTVLPIFHGFGLCMNMLMCVDIGIKNVMSIRFDVKHLAKSIKKEGVNIFMGVPSMFNKLILDKEFCKADLRSIKDCFVGGDRVSQSTVDDFNAILVRGGSLGRLHVGYGLTEAVNVCTVNTAKRSKSGSVGAALPHSEIGIFCEDLGFVERGKVGEICIKSPIMMLDYLDLEGDCSPIKEVDGDRWLFSGDLGHLDEDGFLFFKQRKKNVVKVNGVTVFPSEVEDIALKADGVVLAAAIGVFDQKTGEAVKLFLEVSDARMADLDRLKQEVLDLCEENLICYCRPKYIEIRKNLPLNNLGKIDVLALKGL